jgi:hypothetical protein
MLTFKNVMAIGLFLFGTTFMWMTASFAGRTPPPDGAVWTVENILALVAVIGFAAAGWGEFKELSWWESVAVASAVVGLIAVVPYVGCSRSTSTSRIREFRSIWPCTWWAAPSSWRWCSSPPFTSGSRLV